VHRVRLEGHQPAVGVVGEPVDPVHPAQLGVRRVVEEAEPVLLGMEEVLDALLAQGGADRVGLLGVALPVGEQAGRGRGRVAGRADHPVAVEMGAVDLRLPVGGVDHLLQPAGVRAGGDHAGTVERRLDLLVGDRAVGALVEAEELEPAVADRGEVAEDRREPAGQRLERADVGRIVGEARAAEVAGGRAVEPRDRVAHRPLLQPDPVARHEPSAAVAAVLRLPGRDRR
jgi:hypothetical protein